ncbi:MAG TPA: CAP domain-containing protein [Candidatus Dormibacteraeota bacterium]|nr:CAP domain-containing protein [Candidatus Dormibacteraeota bacterium]
MSFIASRLGSGVVALLVTAGLTLSSTPVEAAAPKAAGKTVVRCIVRHHVRHCVRVAIHTPTRTTKKIPVVHRPQPQPKPTPVTAGPTAPAGSLVAQEIALVNADRRVAGLPALVESGALDRIATARAQDMVVNGYFGHYRPGHTTLAVLELLRANGLPFTWYGENIIWESGQPAASVATHFNTWWMNSPEHRANILNTHYGHIGIGVAVSGSRVYMVEDFTN